MVGRIVRFLAGLVEGGPLSIIPNTQVQHCCQTFVIGSATVPSVPTAQIFFCCHRRSNRRRDGFKTCHYTEYVRWEVVLSKSAGCPYELMQYSGNDNYCINNRYFEVLFYHILAHFLRPAVPTVDEDRGI